LQTLVAENDFFGLVYEVVRLIPPGRVSTYGAIARYLGAARSSRMVGWAMNNSHDCEPPVPAHRVVNRIGLLSGKAHFGSANRMQELLEAEGIEVKDDKVLDFQQLLWDPNIELQV
jgi:methylated-DNA-protein-cysteine methyltransferase-like protein